MKLSLDLNDLAVQSFETSVAGDPSQWTLMAAPPPSAAWTAATRCARSEREDTALRCGGPAATC